MNGHILHRFVADRRSFAHLSHHRHCASGWGQAPLALAGGAAGAGDLDASCEILEMTGRGD